MQRSLNDLFLAVSIYHQLHRVCPYGYFLMADMSHPSADYTCLAEAIRRGDRDRAGELAAELLHRVTLYLRIRMHAPESLAIECAHQAFSRVYEKIRQEKIHREKALFDYFLKAARNEYLRVLRRESRDTQHSGELDYIASQDPPQLDLLIDKERQTALLYCLEELNDLNRRFILAFFAQKKADARAIAQKFRYSYAKTRTLKSRILQELQECVQKSI